MIVENDKRIAKNTVVLYFRMLAILFINLYISRLVLKNLGVSDFGVYNVVGGVVSLFSIIGGALSGACSRFITYELGRDDKKRLNTVFSCSVTAQIIMASIAIAVLETIGVWFLYNKMQIAPDRIQTAFWCLQFSIATCFFNYISVPYTAAIIAHEKMGAFAWISIADCLGRLLIVFVIGHIVSDRLFLYGLLLALFAVIIRSVYSLYCQIHFDECHFRLCWNKEILKEMFLFSLWNFIGYSAAMFRDHGGNILLNVFFGPVVNAARGIAVQVNAAASQFVSNFMTAVGPQITKNYASGNYSEMHKLVFWGSKISFFLFLLISLPIFINTEFILQIWLHEVPAHTIWFVRLVLLCTLNDSFSTALMAAQNATGNIRNYQLIVGGTLLLNLPLSYICLKNGLPAEAVFCVAIAVSVICFILRLLFLRHSIKLNVGLFLKVVWTKAVMTFAASVIPVVYMCKNIEKNWLSFLVSSIACLLWSSAMIYVIGCKKSEKKMLTSVIKKALNRITKGKVC